MTSAIVTPDRVADRTGSEPWRGGFGHLVHAEWTKFRTVRGWLIGLLIGAGLILGLGLMPGVSGSCETDNPALACSLPVGPDGQEVTDHFSFVHQSLTGNGSITVRVTSMTGQIPPDPGDVGRAPVRASAEQARPGVVPWAKAGLIIKATTQQGSAYAAVFVTGSHGVRMQYNYTHDIAGLPGAVSATSPRWLRLTRTDDYITGAESLDGTYWTTLGTAHLAGLPSTVQAGLATTSPQFAKEVNVALGSAVMSGPSRATATFDQVDRQGGWPSNTWKRETIGNTNDGNGPQGGGPDQSGGSGQTRGADQTGRADQMQGPDQAGRFTVSGSGDIAPAVAGVVGLGTTIAQTLVGTFAGLIVMIVLGATFITSEYRRGMIRTTLTASPWRGRVLAAKAIVIGAVTFLAGLVAAAAVVTLGRRVLTNNGVYIHPVTRLTEARVIIGTAALLAVAAVFGVAVGLILRRSAAAITAVIVLIVLPYILAMSVLPTAAAQWALRITPAAAFAIQQSSPRFAQVDNIYTPVNGYFPLAPWIGLAVLCVWTALALGLAAVMFRRREG